MFRPQHEKASPFASPQSLEEKRKVLGHGSEDLVPDDILEAELAGDGPKRRQVVADGGPVEAHEGERRVGVAEDGLDVVLGGGGLGDDGRLNLGEGDGHEGGLAAPGVADDQHRPAFSEHHLEKEEINEFCFMFLALLDLQNLIQSIIKQYQRFCRFRFGLFSFACTIPEYRKKLIPSSSGGSLNLS